jgi:hypothetical protein
VRRSHRFGLTACPGWLSAGPRSRAGRNWAHQGTVACLSTNLLPVISKESVTVFATGLCYNRYYSRCPTSTGYEATALC